jgi:HTH-type transcriptional regulator / antitoxin HigA
LVWEAEDGSRPDSVAAFQFKVEQQGLRQKGLAELLARKNRASEILSRKHCLTVSMIRALSQR